MITMTQENELTLNYHEHSYAGFRIGMHISTYKGQVVKTRDLDVDDEYDYATEYIPLKNPSVVLCCSESGIIRDIDIERHCFYKGTDLIGMDIFDFFILFDREPEYVDLDWAPPCGSNKRGKILHSYCYLLKGGYMVIVSTWRQRIRAVSICNYGINN